MLKVFCADEGSECYTGEAFRPNSATPVAVDVWHCIHTGQAILRNPHGRADVAKAVRSVIPLREKDGKLALHCFQGRAYPD